MPANIGMKIMLYQSTIKATLNANPLIVRGLDIVQWYSEPMEKPKLTSQMGAALEMIAACAGPQRARAKDLIKEIIRTSQTDMMHQVRAHAWGLPDPAQRLGRQNLGRSGNGAGDNWKDIRVELSNIDVNVASDGEETSLQSLIQGEYEVNPHHLNHRTRESLCRGAKIAQLEAAALLWKPCGAFNSFSGTGVAVPGLTASLPANQCVIMHEGEPVLGEFTLFRYPIMRPGDMQRWTAVAPPADLDFLPRNGIICSTQGLGITILSGGDYDGDTLTYTSDKRVLELVSMTLYLHENKRWEEELVGHLQFAESKSVWEKKNRLDEFHDFALTLRESQTRGVACTLFECAQYLFNTSEACPKDTVQEAAYLLSGLAYGAYDAPKKYDGSKILCASRAVMACFQISSGGPRSTEDFGERLSFVSKWKQIQDLDSCTEFFKLEEIEDFNRLGGVWLPAPTITLGRIAGEAIHKEWKTMITEARQGIPCYERSVWRTPLLEIARFLAHKAEGVSETLQYICNRPASDMRACFEGEFRGRDITSWHSFSKKYALL